MIRTSKTPLRSQSTNDVTPGSRPFGDQDARFMTGFERIERMQKEAMRHAFRNHGGFIDSEALTQGLRGVCDQPVSRLARWIVSRSIISVSWRGQTLIPAFQFNPLDMSIVPCVADVLQELRNVFDNWELALWFAAPNAWLDYASPVTLLADDTLAVVQAARTDRFIAFG